MIVSFQICDNDSKIVIIIMIVAILLIFFYSSLLFHSSMTIALFKTPKNGNNIVEKKTYAESKPNTNVSLPGGVPAYGMLAPGPGVHSEWFDKGSYGPGLGYVSSSPSTKKF